MRQKGDWEGGQPVVLLRNLIPRKKTPQPVLLGILVPRKREPTRKDLKALLAVVVAAMPPFQGGGLLSTLQGGLPAVPVLPSLVLVVSAMQLFVERRPPAVLFSVLSVLSALLLSALAALGLAALAVLAVLALSAAPAPVLAPVAPEVAPEVVARVAITAPRVGVPRVLEARERTTDALPFTQMFRRIRSLV